MYVQYQINLENPPEIEGISWKILRGKSVSQPFSVEEVNEFSERNKEILFEKNNISVILLGYECGGGLSNTGSATILCGPSGEPLKGVYLSRSCNSVHAMFIRNSLIEVSTSYWNKGCFKFSTRLCYFYVDDNHLVKQKDLLQLDFNSETLDETLPEIHQKFRDAIIASTEKATCYHCREPHYLKN